MAGAPEVPDKLKKGYKAIGRTYKNHIDGVSLLDYLTGKAEKSPRKMFVYISDDGDTLGLRYDNWKVVFMEQRCKGTMAIWGEPFTELRVAKLFNLRTDPYEFADITSNSYWDWYLDRAFILVPCQDIIGEYLGTLKEFPPAQRAGSFNLEKVMDTLQFGSTGGA